MAALLLPVLLLLLPLSHVLVLFLPAFLLILEPLNPSVVLLDVSLLLHIGQLDFDILRVLLLLFLSLGSFCNCLGEHIQIIFLLLLGLLDPLLSDLGCQVLGCVMHLALLVHPQTMGSQHLLVDALKSLIDLLSLNEELQTAAIGGLCSHAIW